MKLKIFSFILASFAVAGFAGTNSQYHVADLESFNLVVPVVPDTSSVSDKQSGMIVFDVSTLQFKGLDTLGNWNAFNTGTVTSTSEVTVDSGNGHGSTNIRIRRFSNIRKNTGSDITYADSATLGASFTINTSGVYAISYADLYSASSFGMGITVNDGALGTIINLVTYSQGLRTQTYTYNSGEAASISWTGNLSAGDVVRAHTDGNPDSTSATSIFTVTRVR